MTSFDLARARAETSGCSTVAHFNNAGAALQPDVVVDAVVSHLLLEARIGGYEAADAAATQISHANQAAALLVGGHMDEISIVESATRAWTSVFNAMRFREGDRLLVSRAEYVSNAMAMLRARHRFGITVDLVPDDEHGQIDVDALALMIDDRVRLIAVTHVGTQGAMVNPAAAVGRVARAAGVAFLLDASQSVGQMPVDVNDIGCDYLVATGRKFLRAPRGTAFLYVRRERVADLDPDVFDNHGATWNEPFGYVLDATSRRFETFEQHIAGRIGLGVAIDYARAWGLDAIQTRVCDLAASLRAQLDEVPGVRLHDVGLAKCAIVTFTVAGHDPATIRAALRAQRLNVSVTDAGSAMFDLPARGLSRMVRASPHYYNDETEITRLVEAVRELASR